jgi:hypothetical protein
MIFYEQRKRRTRVLQKAERSEAKDKTRNTAEGGRIF